MYLCVMDADCNVLLHRNLPARPMPFLRAIAPYKDDLVVAAECVFTWYWLADLCRDAGIPFVLGHAHYMKAIHGAKAKNDRIDSKKIAALLVGRNYPLAYVYPQRMRSTRDLLRRRTFLVRKRAELIAHIENTASQYNLAGFQKSLRRKVNRAGVPQCFGDPSARKSVEVNLALIDFFDRVITDLELYLVRAATEHEPQSLFLLKTIPGVGKILSLVILYEVHDIERFPRAQEFLSYSRLVRCRKESAGKSLGTSGSKIGNPHLKWAFSEAACLFLRDSPQAKKYMTRLERKHPKGKALGILTQKLGRAVYYMLKRRKPFDAERFFKGKLPQPIAQNTPAKKVTRNVHESTAAPITA
jgi:transposase